MWPKKGLDSGKLLWYTNDPTSGIRRYVLFGKSKFINLEGRSSKFAFVVGTFLRRIAPLCAPISSSLFGPHLKQR
jgi:hypothetical protein